MTGDPQRLKELGNKEYSAGRYAEADSLYSQALRSLVQRAVEGLEAKGTLLTNR